MNGDIVDELEDWAGLCQRANDVESYDTLTLAIREIQNLRRRLQACQSHDSEPLTGDTITQNERILLDQIERLRAERNN